MARSTLPPPVDGAVAAAPRQACPSCGVAVMPGYVKCPRCHSALPKVPRALRLTAGGTALGGTGESDDEARAPWALLAIGGVLIAVLVAWLVMRDSGGATTVAPPDVPPSQVAAVAPTTTPGPQVAAPSGSADPIVTTGPTVEQARAAAVQALDVRLRRDRMWAKLEVVGEQLVIVSAACADPPLSAGVKAEGAALLAAGLRTIQCRAPHGETMWTLELR